jgi:TolA-binding protein
MKRWAISGVSTACIVLAMACEDNQTEVQRQTQELQEAQKNVGQVTSQLGADLDKAKGDVVRLEQKLAMARQGLTDDVIENQRELQEALKAQEKKVETELNEASREAEIHTRDTQAALQALSKNGNGEAPARDEIVPVRGGPDPLHGEADAGAQRTAPAVTDPHLAPPVAAPAPSATPPVSGPAPEPTPAPDPAPAVPAPAPAVPAPMPAPAPPAPH